MPDPTPILDEIHRQRVLLTRRAREDPTAVILGRAEVYAVLREIAQIQGAPPPLRGLHVHGLLVVVSARPGVEVCGSPERAIRGQQIAPADNPLGWGGEVTAHETWVDRGTHGHLSVTVAGPWDREVSDLLPVEASLLSVLPPQFHRHPGAPAETLVILDEAVDLLGSEWQWELARDEREVTGHPAYVAHLVCRTGVSLPAWEAPTARLAALRMAVQAHHVARRFRAGVRLDEVLREIEEDFRAATERRRTGGHGEPQSDP